MDDQDTALAPLEDIQRAAARRIAADLEQAIRRAHTYGLALALQEDGSVTVESEVEVLAVVNVEKEGE